MKNIKLIFIFVTALVSFTTSNAQNARPAINYLQVKGPLLFQKTSYNLVWSSHPAAHFYKQEYMAKGEVVDRFKTMILLDLSTGATKMKEIVAAKIEELKKLKQTNPFVQYEAFDNTASGEYMIDFLLSANAPDGSISIAERNVYRYKTVTDKDGKTDVLLFGVSTRSYGAGVPKFLTDLKATKANLVNAVAQMTLPVITVPQ